MWEGMTRSRLLSILAMSTVASASFAGQDGALTLEGALDLAKQNNGTVRAAHLNYEASRSSARSAYAAFLPTLTPSLSHDEVRSQTFTGAFKGVNNSSTSTASASLNWLLLDNGSRDASYKRAVFTRDASELSALQTLRQILFSVHSRFYDAIRTEEQLKVQDRQIARAQEILDQTKFRASDEIGDAPKKDIRQAEADFLNARVSQLTAQNRTATSLADLKAILGLGLNELPSLSSPQAIDLEPLEMSLEEAIEEGLEGRPDLQGSRLGILATMQSVRQTKLSSGVTFTVDANHRSTFSGDPFNSTSLQFFATFPLYDGNRSKELLKSAELNLKAQQHNLVQSERDAAAEIESAYKEYSQNLLRNEAAAAAKAAAQENYEAAVGAREEGAGTLLEILTAQVSLSTAESNLVEARFDALISEVRFKLAIGRPMPGEDESEE